MMILQSLRMKPMHGYVLAKHIKQVSDDLLQIEEGSLYPALQRMLKQGWLKSKFGVSEKNRPIRIYSLTNAGLKHLEQASYPASKRCSPESGACSRPLNLRSSLWDGLKNFFSPRRSL